MSCVRSELIASQLAHTAASPPRGVGVGCTRNWPPRLRFRINRRSLWPVVAFQFEARVGRTQRRTSNDGSRCRERCIWTGGWRRGAAERTAVARGAALRYGGSCRPADAVRRHVGGARGATASRGSSATSSACAACTGTASRWVGKRPLLERAAGRQMSRSFIELVFC